MTQGPIRSALAFLLHLLACTLALSSTTEAAAATEGCHRPAQDIGDGWEIARAAAPGFDATQLCGALDTLTAGHDNIHGVVVERQGRLVAELYRDGPDRPINVRLGLPNPFAGDARFDARTPHDTRSISKSVVSLLVGVALEKGAIASVSAPVLNFFPEHADLLQSAPQRQRITLEHLLTMSSGLSWDEGGLPNDETRLFWTAELPPFVLDRPFDHEPGQRFHYNSGGTALLAEVLARAQRTKLSALAREQLFEPLGIRNWEWATDLHGRELAFTGLRMRPRDLAKLGRLVLAQGRWQGKARQGKARQGKARQADRAGGLGRGLYPDPPGNAAAPAARRR